ncbi:MAG: hypothetical protein AAGI01_12340 [Myxococcota bacterium]
MDVHQFEQEVLRLAFETDTRITPASVAYYLGLPSREVKRLLDELLKTEVLELDSDEDGNLYYRVPNKGALKMSPEARRRLDSLNAPIPRLVPERPRAITGGVATEHFSASITGEDDRKAFSPMAFRPPSAPPLSSVADGATQQDPSLHRPSERPTGWGSLASASGRHVPSGVEEPTRGHASVLGPAVQRVSQSLDRPPGPRRGVLSGVTARSTDETDAWIGNSHASAMIVSSSARCEPKPLPDARPTIVACVDPEEERRIAAHQQREMQQMRNPAMETWRAHGNQAHASTAMVVANPAQNQLAHFEAPEHQPGMALLLSLILCGTGQIYNGEVSKGIMMMVLCFLLWFVLLGWVVHIWSIVDAVVVAERINRRQHV